MPLMTISTSKMKEVMSDKKRKKSFDRLNNPFDGTRKRSKQVHKDKTKYDRKKKHKKDYRDDSIDKDQ